jgi:hypothetical protein
MLIDVELLATICVILPPAPSVLQEGSSDAYVYTRGGVRRASGFVLTGDKETNNFREFWLEPVRYARYAGEPKDGTGEGTGPLMVCFMLWSLP